LRMVAGRAEKRKCMQTKMEWTVAVHFSCHRPGRATAIEFPLPSTRPLPVARSAACAPSSSTRTRWAII
jgi:hypothetical protein